jgi:hypothetical protein
MLAEELRVAEIELAAAEETNEAVIERFGDEEDGDDSSELRDLPVETVE